VIRPVTSTRLLLFDIDGTLLLSGGAGLRALNQTFEEQFGVSDAFAGIPVAGRTDPLLLTQAAARAHVALDGTTRQRFHDRYCVLLETEIVHPAPRKGLMPGVDTLLRHLHPREELCVSLLTGNFARAAQIKLVHFGLWEFFVCGAYGDDAAERDELVPVALARARQRGVAIESPADVVVIGDTPLDVQCATVSGARSIAVATGSFDEVTLARHGATAVLSDLADQEAFLDALERC
jgi:phosphoglycolate phosphatase-like HAD superfamily hydrolase